MFIYLSYNQTKSGNTGSHQGPLFALWPTIGEDLNLNNQNVTPLGMQHVKPGLWCQIHFILPPRPTQLPPYDLFAKLEHFMEKSVCEYSPGSICVSSTWPNYPYEQYINVNKRKQGWPMGSCQV